MQAADVGLDRDVHIAVLVCPVFESGLEEEVPDLHLVLRVEVHVAVDAALTDEVLVLHPAADGPAEHLHSQGVLFTGGVEVVGDVEVVGSEAVGGIAHGLAVDVQVIGGLHALERDEDLAAIPVLRRGEGGAVVAHRVVHRGGVGVPVVDVLPLSPGKDLVGIHRLIVLEGAVLVAVGLPGLGHILRLESIAGIFGSQVLRVQLSCGRRVLGDGEIPILTGEELIEVGALGPHIVQHALLGGQGGGGVLIGDELGLGALAVDADDIGLVIPLVAREVRSAFQGEFDGLLEVFLVDVQDMVVDIGALIGRRAGRDDQEAAQHGQRQARGQETLGKFSHSGPS